MGLSHRMRVALATAQRRRIRSLRGVPKIHRTRLIPVGTSPFPLDDAFPSGSFNRPITFSLDYDVTDASADGTVLNCGATNPALTLYYTNGTLNLIAGSGVSSAQAVQAAATRPHRGRVQLVVSIRPGDGHARVWDQYGLLAQAEATGGSIPAWAAGSEDITLFGAAAGPNGLIADPGAPSGFEQLAPVRGYALYVPQHFLTNIPDDVVFDDFLYNATTINFQLAKFPLLDDTEV